MQTPFQHLPVLLDAVLNALQPQPGGVYIDGTVGGAGHAQAILQRAGAGARLLGLDRDPAALAAAAARLAQFGPAVQLAYGNFRDLLELARAHGISNADGILLDLGVSSHQLDTAERGFSFLTDAALDMRLDPAQELTAADLVNQLDERELADTIYRYGEEHASRRIARMIVEARQRAPLRTTSELAALVSRALGGRHGKIHPATRTFQALRIAVNDELGSLEAVLPQAVELLRSGGRLAVISFHSLEDRIVKQFLRAEAGQGGEEAGARQISRVRILSKKPIEASAEEQQINPRSRSAKLRVAERIGSESSTASAGAGC